MSSMAAHDRHEVPLPGRGGVLHQIPDELHAQVHRRCEAEGRDLRRQRKVVVDGLGDMDDRHLAVEGPRDPRGAERGVVAANGEEMRRCRAGAAIRRRAGGPPETGWGWRGQCAGWSRPRSGSGRPRRCQHVRSGEIPLHEPPEAALAAEHPEPLIPGLDGRRRDDRVDARRGAAAHQDRQRLHVLGYATTCSISGA